MDITDRQKKLLLAIVREFIETADAVASMQLVDKYRLPLSSATIRAEMKQLAEAGYLRQLHTSSGRVPTATGIRYFINKILEELEELELLEQEKIKREMFEVRFTIEDLVRESLRNLTRLTQTASVMVLGKNLYHYGIADMLDMPEFQNVSDFQRVLRVIEDYPTLLSIIKRNSSPHRVKIIIGHESGIKGLENFSLVFADVMLHGGTHGYLCSVGPARMRYNRVIPAVDYIAAVLRQVSTGWR